MIESEEAEAQSPHKKAERELVVDGVELNQVIQVGKYYKGNTGEDCARIPCSSVNNSRPNWDW
jgi:hypothetical protein